MTDQPSAITVRNYMRSPEIMERFQEAIGEQRAASYISSVLLAVTQNTQLQACEPQSIAISAMRAATLRLSCDPATGQAHLVPFKGKATLIVGYKGMIQMALRTGKYRYLHVYPICEGQEITEDWKTGHHSLNGKKTSDRIIGHLLSFALVTGFEKTVYMTVDEIHEHARKHSKSYNYKDSPWKTHPYEMEQKTLVRLGLGKWGYFDPHDVTAMGQADEVVEEMPVDVTVEEAPEMSANEILETLGYDVDTDTGEVLEGESEPAPPQTKAMPRPSAPQPPPPADEEEFWIPGEEAEAPVSPPPPPNGNGKIVRPMSADQLRNAIEKKAAGYGDRQASGPQVGLLANLLNTIFQDETKRHNFQVHILGEGSLKNVPGAKIQACLDWLKPTQDTGGMYTADEMAVREAHAAWNDFQIASGQQELF